MVSRKPLVNSDLSQWLLCNKRGRSIEEQSRFPILLSAFVYKMYPKSITSFCLKKKVSVLLFAFNIVFNSWIGLMSRICQARWLVSAFGLALDLKKVKECFFGQVKKEAKLSKSCFQSELFVSSFSGSISHLLGKPLLNWIVWIKVYTVPFVSSIAQAFLDLLVRIMWDIYLRSETFSKNLSIHHFVVPIVFQNMDTLHGCHDRLENNYTEWNKWRWP